MTLNQKTLLLAIVLFLGISMPPVAFAGNLQDSRKDYVEARQEVRVERKDFFQEMKEKTGNVFKRLIGAGKAVIVSGKITVKTDTTLTVEKDGISYTVNFGSNTHLRRKFWGKSDSGEFAAGNTVNVYGAWTDDTKTAINARLIRNISIQKRFGVFFGEVKSLLGSGWVMTTVSGKRADQTVTVSSETKFVNRREETIGQADVQVGHRVRVKGLWDNINNTITEVTQVKNFSLPPILTPTATPTP